MRLSKNHFMLLICLSLSQFNTSLAADLPKDIMVAFNDGNARMLAGFFNTRIELTIFDEENIYSKTQAHQILESFFHQFPPKEFYYIYHGGKDNSKYAIGEFNCTKNEFRVTIYLKNNDRKFLIHQLRIEHDNNQ